MNFLLDVDLDWLCLGAEFAAGLLILSLAWRPRGNTTAGAGPLAATVVDWEPLQTAHARAVIGSARSLALRSNPTDEQRLRDLLDSLPNPYRDRLTGTWNANGMDRLIREWSCESDMAAYPSCYVMLTLASVEDFMERHGAVCIERALKRVSEYLKESIGGSATIARYQPHSFLLHQVGKSLPECRAAIAALCEQIAAPEFFLFRDDPVCLRFEPSYWYCNRSVEPEEILEMLSECGETLAADSEEQSERAIPVAESEPVPASSTPSSFGAFAPFPCPWDDSADKRVESTVADSPDQIDEDAAQNDSHQAKDAEEKAPEKSKTLEGFASAKQIDELLAQLKGSVDPDAVLEKAFLDVPPAAEQAQTPSDLVAASPTLDPGNMQESLLQEDIASLFAAMRPNAANSISPRRGESHGPANPS